MFLSLKIFLGVFIIIGMYAKISLFLSLLN